MLRRARMLAALVLAAAAVFALAGCVGISSTNSTQPASMGPVTLTVAACANGSPGCKATANTGSVYEFVDTGNSSLEGQALLAVRLPDGPTPPANLSASLSGGGTLAFSRSASYESQLQTLEPAPAGERWWGWLSAKFTYSESTPQGFSVSMTVDPPTLAEGPSPSPMRWRPVVGSRVVDTGVPASRAVVCGSTPNDLYDGYNELGGPGSTVACIDSPDEAATRGYLGAPITDFGITGSSVQTSAGGNVTATFLARRSGTADPGTTFSLAAATGIPGGTVAIDRASVSLGGESTNPVLATVTVPAGTPPGSYPVTLTATAPGKPTRSATATVTVPGAAQPPKGTSVDLTASLKPKRFRAGTVKGKAAKGLPPVGAKLKLNVSRPAALEIRVEKKKPGKKAFAQVGTVRRNLPSGPTTIQVKKKLGSVKLTPGAYRLQISAAGDGLVSPTRTVAFTFVAG